MTRWVYIVACLIVCCAIDMSGQFDCDVVEGQLIPEVPGFCRDSLDELNAPIRLNSVPFKEISVMFHIVRDADGLNNFQDTPDDRARLQEYIDEANHILANLERHVIPNDCEYSYTPESRIRLVLQGVIYYNHSDYVCTDTKCQSDRDEVYKYCVSENSNLSNQERESYYPLIMVGWRGDRGGEVNDCGRDGCQTAVKILGGVGASEYSILRGVYANRSLIGHIAELILHEMCHSFGLRHVSFDKFRCCASWEIEMSNNLMDLDNLPPYYDTHRALVDCQLGILHYTMENSIMSKVLANDLCEKQTPPIIIPQGTTVVWDIKEMVSQDVKVEGTLIIDCDVKLAFNVEIIESGNGDLVFAGGVVDTCFSVATHETMRDSRVLVYPNPVGDILNIQVENSKNWIVQLVTQDARLIANKENVTELDLAGIPPGVYVVIFTLDEGLLPIRIIKI